MCLIFDMASVSPARYPLAITDHLPTDRPTAHKLMGKELVVWRDGQGDWSVMEDSCPHRWGATAVLLSVEPVASADHGEVPWGTSATAGESHPQHQCLLEGLRRAAPGCI